MIAELSNANLKNISFIHNLINKYIKNYSYDNYKE